MSVNSTRQTMSASYLFQDDAHTNPSKPSRPVRLLTSPPNLSVRRSFAVEGPGCSPTTERSDQPLAENMPPPGNRKKQRRRQKQATRLIAGEQQPCADAMRSIDLLDQNGHSPHESIDPADSDGEEAEHDMTINGELSRQHPGELRSGTDYREPPTKSGKPKKKKRPKKDRLGSQTHIEESSTSLSTPSASILHPPPPPPPGVSNSPRLMRKASNDRIWNTSTQEERENIKKFWLELGEEERRALVKVEKDAVLKKMKEQQKHSCSCTVCGRKRTAIEEELEVLYDAYYEELEQYANGHQSSFENGAPIMPPPRLYQPHIRTLDRHAHFQGQHQASRGRVHEIPDDDDEMEDEYDEDEDDEPYSEEELEDEATRTARADFFAFGNSLTVKDGILTVADDLLKNDGKHFIDMMEQLAERRMQREEDPQDGIAAAHRSLHAGHTHPPMHDDDYDEEEDEDYDSQDEEEYEEDEMDAMTEEQRMEEGRRMFQIFAARMFEQRVLIAYREKVAEQRQEKLLQELLEEKTLVEQRTAKKAREAQKRKDKKRQQKQAKEEEKARREAEKAAEEAATKALEEKKQEEQRRKREEQRRKKETEKKAQEEERLRKEAEKQRRLQEERERQAEVERKQREQKEREKKKREEARRKEREEREVREKENREKRAKEDRGRRAREEQVRKEDAAAAAARAELEMRERAKRDVPAAPPPSGPATKRSSQSITILPPGMQLPQGTTALHSPHFQVATPVVPKAPTPARPRQASQQGSHASSPRSQAAGMDTLASISPQTIPLSHSSGASSNGASSKGPAPPPVLHHPQPSAPLSPLGAAGRSHTLPFPPINGLPSHHPPPGIPGVVPRPGMSQEIPLLPPHSTPGGAPFRGFPTPNGVPVAPPGINGTSRPIQPGRGFPTSEPGHGLPFSGPQSIPGVMSAQQACRPQGHVRQASGSLERSPLDLQSQTLPITRPPPIRRPSSTGLQESPREGEKLVHSAVDELSAQLGSSALLDDADISFASNTSQPLPNTTASAGSLGSARTSFATSPMFADPLGPSKHPNFPSSDTWGPQLPFGAPGFQGGPTWGPGTGGGWPNNAFGIRGHHRAHTSRPVAIRLLVIQACKQLNTMSPTKGTGGFHDVNQVLRQVEQLKPASEPPILLQEMLDICDTEGNPQNGGGSFTIKDDGNGKFVKFEPDNNSNLSGHRGNLIPGDIGSPVPSSSVPALGGIGAASGPRQFSSPPMSF